MHQLTLTGEPHLTPRLETSVQRSGSLLQIPEGPNTIPCTHGLHRFPGKFIPNIPRYLIREVLPKEASRTVFDPFCGSGTTLVEAALEGRTFLGADLDPLSVLISRAKTHLIEPRKLANLKLTLSTIDYTTPAPELVPAMRNIGHWFSEETIAQLSSIKRACLSLPDGERDFGLVIFSSIIRRVSNADDQTQKTYVSHTLPKSPPRPCELFPVFLARATRGMEEYARFLPASPRGMVIRADARDMQSRVGFDDILTSPPYIDSIEYVYNQMLEYHWLASELGLQSLDKLRATQQQLIGFKAAGPELDALQIGQEFFPRHAEEFKALCDRIAAVSPVEESRVRMFFADYAKHVAAARGLQSPRDCYVTVIGNSRVRGSTIPTVDILSEIHQGLGYTLTDRFSYAIRRHYMKFPRHASSGKIGEDNILIFRAE